MKKNGRKPLGQKARPMINPDEAFSNKLAIPEAIRKDLESKGLEPHWLDSKKLAENGGYHDRDWEVYKKPNEMVSDKPAFKFGNDPEGIFRRGSLILGYKTKERADKHREFLQAKADRYKAMFDKEKAAELREHIKSNDLDSAIEVTSGLDEDDE